MLVRLRSLARVSLACAIVASVVLLVGLVFPPTARARVTAGDVRRGPVPADPGPASAPGQATGQIPGQVPDQSPTPMPKPAPTPAAPSTPTARANSSTTTTGPTSQQSPASTGPSRTPSPDQATPSPTPSAGPTPVGDLACSGPTRTVAEDPGRAWRGVVVDPVRRLPQGWRPDDLVDVGEVGYAGVPAPQVRRLVARDLRAMHRAARRAHAPFVVVSAFRSQARQADLWDRAVASEGGVDAARAGTAPPGHSEHQLGTTVDVVDPSLPELVPGLARTPAGTWLAEHAVDFGFVVSYPAGASDVTCYKPEPWHLRYVGPELAADVERSPLTPREYLLAGRADVEPAQTQTPAPARNFALERGHPLQHRTAESGAG